MEVYAHLLYQIIIFLDLKDLLLDFQMVLTLILFIQGFHFILAHYDVLN